MTSSLDSRTSRRALQQRLLTVATILLTTRPAPDADASESELLSELVAAVQLNPRADWMWLLFVAVAARFPTPEEVTEGRRAFELSGVTDSILWLLDCSLAGAALGSNPAREIVLIRHAVLVDVDRSAKQDLHTGIQQVVRHLLPRWSRNHGVIPVAWTDRAGALRTLVPSELVRTMHWFGDDRSASPGDDDRCIPLLVPWHCVVVAAEVTTGHAALRMSALAQFSGTRLAAIGYDCIPVVSADLVPTGRAFIEYLNMIKQADRVAGISTSATIEFQGFVDMLPAQGLKGPVVECVELGSQRPTNRPSRRALTERPMVLMVGSLEPRKNQLAVLHAAEKLWRGGLDFELTFICGSEWGTEIPDRIDELSRAGRPINVHRQADSIALEKAYHAARFSVFPSKHEGYGLPVVESLAAGTPVITSNFGCMLALAAQGGALVVDPEDDASLEAAMRALLTDDDTIEELRAQIPRRPRRDWDDYANELWSTLVAPLLTLDESTPS